MFEIAALVRLMEAVSFIETASPPASSAGLVIRFPLDSLVRLSCRFLLFFARLKDARMAAGFVFIVSDMGYILHDVWFFLRHHAARPFLSRYRKPVLNY